MKKRAVKISFATAAASALLLLLLLVLKRYGLHLPCVVNVLSNGALKCPTCGATRATMRLLEADIEGAVKYNPLIFFVWLYIIKFYSEFCLHYIRDGEFIKKRFDLFDAVGVGVFVLWGIIRNILHC